MATFGNWQKELQTLVDKSLSETGTFFSEFKDLPSDERRVEFILNCSRLKDIEWLCIYFEVCEQLHRKNVEKSALFRTEGNKWFQKQQYEKAVELYTKSVHHSPWNVEEKTFSLALANRSAALFHLSKWKECLLDINRAMKYDYPEHLQYKIRLRKVQCLIKLHQVVEANTEIFDIERDYPRNLDDRKFKSFLKDLNTCKEDIEKLKISENIQESPEAKVKPAVSYGFNTVITQATSSVDLRYNMEQGRHLIANQNIEAGDVLILERPYAAVLLPDHYMSHCHHCFRSISSSFPCKSCSLVRYCSEECQRESWDCYHEVECCYMDLFHSVGIAHLSLRVVLTAGLEFLKDFRKRRSTNNIDTSNAHISGCNKEGKYERNYLTVYELLPHTENMLTEDLFQYSMTAGLLLLVLAHQGWLKKENTKERDIETLSNAMSADDFCIGGLLLRHIQQLVCNAHAITELQVTQTNDLSLVDSKSQVRVATAIYPTASLMNHSCDPSIISSFDGDLLVVRAVKDVPKGGEIFNCYGPHHKRMKKAERLQILRNQYFFDCCCESCISDDEITGKYEAFKCQACGDMLCQKKRFYQCSSCGQESKFEKEFELLLSADRLFAQGLHKLEALDIDGAVHSLEDCLTVRERYLYKYHKHLAEVHDCIARCYGMLGKYENAICHLGPSIKITEVIYGETSIELANELLKQAEIFFNAKHVEDALQVIDRAVKLFQMHYGRTCKEVQQLTEMKDCLISYKNNTEIS